MMHDLTMAAGIVVLSLSITAILAGSFVDNWPQHAGLWAVAFATATYLIHMTQSDAVLSSREATLMVGIAFYAVGTAIKVRRHNRPKS